MTVSSSLALALAVFIFAVIPGPGVFATVSRALSSGFRHSLAVIGGIICGDIVYLLFALFGLSALAGVLGRLFFLVKLLGGGYLIWLGVHLLLNSGKLLTDKNNRSGMSGGFFHGLLVSLSNPKVILFYCGFLPAFLDFNALGAFDILLVGFIVPAALASGLSLYALAARSAGAFLVRGTAAAWTNRVAGSVLIAAGAMIALRD
ncbi:LysE family translocator [bacterium]|nr:LysE family translocator [bacterium]